MQELHPASPGKHAGNMTGSCRHKYALPFILIATTLLPVSLSSAHADPLSPVTGTVEAVTETVGKTVSGAGRTVEKTVSTTGQTVGGTMEKLELPSQEREATPVDTLGRAILGPAGSVLANEPDAPPSAGQPRQEANRQDVTQPHDVFQSSIPDVLPRGTLARIYFKPGETRLDGAARNRILGFAENFRQRVGNVDIKGYASRARGDDAVARDIAMQRALAVQEALLAQGLGSGRIRASAMGNTDRGGAVEDRVDIRFDGY
jgi:outer membrane protein OmpA-like peptidoglycan-associated protein